MWKSRGLEGPSKILGTLDWFAIDRAESQHVDEAPAPDGHHCDRAVDPAPESTWPLRGAHVVGGCLSRAIPRISE